MKVNWEAFAFLFLFNWKSSFGDGGGSEWSDQPGRPSANKTLNYIWTRASFFLVSLFPSQFPTQLRSQLPSH